MESESPEKVIGFIAKLITLFIVLNLVFFFVLHPNSLPAIVLGELVILWVAYLLKDIVRQVHFSGPWGLPEYGNTLEIMERMQTERDERQFYGRRSEYRHLMRLLSDPEGGSILLAGRRGSGKTRLVQEFLSDRTTIMDSLPNIIFVVLLIPIATLMAAWGVFKKRTELKKKERRYLSIELPLIVINTESGRGDNINRAEEYRSVILRTLAFALIDKVRYGQIPRRILLKNFWMIVALRIKIKSLKKFVDYVNLNDYKNTNISFMQAPAAMNIRRVVAGQLDISDAKLEMTLISIFKSLDQTGLKLVIILDELDKLTATQGKTLEIEDVVLYLKNLFSQKNVHAVVIAGYSQALPFIRAFESKRDEANLTLFKDVIILNALDPHAFDELARRKIVGPGGIQEENQAKMLDQVVHGLGMHTEYVPGLLNSFLKKCDPLIEDTHILLSKALGNRYTARTTVLRSYVNWIHRHILYDEHQLHHDDGHFNAILHQILCKAADNLIFRRVRYFSLEDLETILYDQQTIALEEGQAMGILDFVLDYKTQAPLVSNKPEMIKLFEHYGGVFRDALQQSLLLLVIFLERSEIITLSFENQDNCVMRLEKVDMQVKQLSSEIPETSHSKVFSEIINKLSRQEEKHVEFVSGLYSIARDFLNNAELISEMLNRPGLPLSLGKDGEIAIKGKNEVNALLVEWRQLHKLLPKFRHILLQATRDALDLHRYECEEENDEKLCIDFRIAGNKRFRLCFLLAADERQELQDNDLHRTIVIIHSKSNCPRILSSKYKTFDAAKGLVPVRKYIDDWETKLQRDI